MNKEEIIKGILEKLYEEKSFTIPNGGDIPKVEITYEDWVWIEQFLAKEITDLSQAHNQELLEKIISRAIDETLKHGHYMSKEDLTKIIKAKLTP